jgi:hypothetical protein
VSSAITPNSDYPELVEGLFFLSGAALEEKSDASTSSAQTGLGLILAGSGLEHAA